MKKSHKNKYSPNLESKKAKSNHRKESFKIKESELSPIKKAKENDTDSENNSILHLETHSEPVSMTMVHDRTQEMSNSPTDNGHTINGELAEHNATVLIEPLNSLSIGADSLTDDLVQENAELKSKLEALQTKFDKLLTAYKKAKVKEKEAACVSPEEVTELYAQLEQAKTKLFHFKDPNRASQKGILKKSVTFNEVPEIHQTVSTHSCDEDSD